MHPRSVTIGSSATIIVRGNFFRSTRELQCRLDEAIDVPATATSDKEIRCEFPKALLRPAYSTVRVEVSLNGVDFSDSGAKLQFLPPLQVLDVEPKYLILGREQYVRVKVTDIGSAHAVFCQLGEGVSITASVISQKLVECPIPALLVPGQRRLEIPNNGVDYMGGTDAESTLIFFPSPVVLSTTRNGGSVLGGDTIQVEGVDFSPQLKLSCEFDQTLTEAIY